MIGGVDEWIDSVHTAKTRILDVVYNASNNELVRTKTLVKNAIVQACPSFSFPHQNYSQFPCL